MFFTQNALAAHPRMAGHLQELTANRNIWNGQHSAMMSAFRSAMTPEMLAANSVGGLGRDFWAEVDRQVIQLRNQEVGMDVVNDLLGVQTTLPIGKTVKLYNVTSDIAEDVALSIDGQAPYSFDHAEIDADGDPIPVFTAGYGVNWRHAAGMSSVGIDLVLESQAAKLRKYNKALVGYLLNGSARINVDGKVGQGIKTHRNTIKVNLGSGAGGVNLDLTTATQAELVTFFTSGAFGTTARENFVDAYDVLWVSPQIWANLSKPASVTLSGGSVMTSLSVLGAIQGFVPAREIRQTFALKGNEYFAYQRRQDVITPLVGMATGVVPLPRPLPQTNYNFQIMGAMGLQIKRDGEGRSGVQYGGVIA